MERIAHAPDLTLDRTRTLALLGAVPERGDQPVRELGARTTGVGAPEEAAHAARSSSRSSVGI